MTTLVLLVVVLGAIIVLLGIVIGRRRRISGDDLERLDPADEPNRSHNDGQAKAAAALIARSGGGRFSP